MRSNLTPAVPHQLWSLYQEEIRRSVKLDNEKRLEKLREELRTEVNTVEQKYKNEVRSSGRRDGN